jgi:hypothetical protein
MQNIINISHIHDDYFHFNKNEVETILEILISATNIIPSRNIYAHGINTLCKGDINQYMDFIQALFHTLQMTHEEISEYEDWFYQNTSFGEIVICILKVKNQHE